MTQSNHNKMIYLNILLLSTIVKGIFHVSVEFNIWW